MNDATRTAIDSMVFEDRMLSSDGIFRVLVNVAKETGDLKIVDDEYVWASSVQALWPLASNHAAATADVIRRGEIAFIDPDVMAITRHAIASLPDDEVFKADDLPSLGGFVRFGTPMSVQMLGVRRLEGFGPLDQDDVTIGGFAYAAKVESGEIESVDFWAFDTDLRLVWLSAIYPNFHPNYDHASVQVHRWSYKLLIAYGRVVRDRMHESPQDVGRAAKRQAERRGRQLPPVRVAYLRRTQHGATGSSDVDWSHRWVVSGHWRNHWHPKEQEHRRRWIESYIKGPDDKPLVVRPTVKLVK